VDVVPIKFHQWNFVGISTVVCGNFWGVEQIQNGDRYHSNQGAKMLNSLQTVDPFETWHKNYFYIGGHF
jgi:hypothetical protein